MEQEESEAFFERYKDLDLKTLKADVNSYSAGAVKKIFTELWGTLTEHTTEKYKRRLAGDLVAWMFEMYPSLADEFQLRS